jgi:hypothetical protein
MITPAMSGQQWNNGTTTFAMSVNSLKEMNFKSENSMTIEISIV